MNLLFRIVYATHANGTHHKLALDALRHLESPNSEKWQRLFLQHAEIYLEGSKAPDKQFKDFKNHVLHVGDNYWGGAPEKVENWYRKLVETLQARSWHEAVWAAGIMSHYYTDPIHPFHTAQSTAENEIHRAVEWSMSKSYGALARRNQGRAPPVITPGTDATWIKDHVIAGAELSNRSYETLIAHYDFHRGVVEPTEGLDEVCQALTSDLILYAAVGHARLLDRAFAEAGVEPPEVSLTAETFVATLKIPLKWVTRKLEDAGDRREVEAIYDELTATGKVEETLPVDDRQVRDFYEAEVLGRREAEREAQRRERRAHPPLPQGQIPVLASAVASAGQGAETSVRSTVSSAAPSNDTAPTKQNVRDDKAAAPAAPPATSATSVPVAGRSQGTAPVPPPPAGRQSLSRLLQRSAAEHNGTPEATETTREPRPARYYLALTDELAAAPSIGPKTAARFATIGINTVAEFLDADPEIVADLIGSRYITIESVTAWQQQARLVCDVPGLRGSHAQLLVGAGLTSIDAVADAEPSEAMAAILRFAQTSAGQDILRDGQPPDLEKIHAWVQGARDAQQAA